jgi:hypothetical protein
MDNTIQDFKIGDKVVHKTNLDEIMLITHIGPGNLLEPINCKWISNNGNLHKEQFAPFELIRYRTSVNDN